MEHSYHIDYAKPTDQCLECQEQEKLTNVSKKDNIWTNENNQLPR